jgi:hypothetical protein
MRGVSLGPNWFRLLNIGILSLITFTIIMRLDHKAWQMMLVFAVIGSGSWDSIVVLLFALVISSSENRLGQPSL